MCRRVGHCNANYDDMKTLALDSEIAYPGSCIIFIVNLSQDFSAP